MQEPFPSSGEEVQWMMLLCVIAMVMRCCKDCLQLPAM